MQQQRPVLEWSLSVQLRHIRGSLRALQLVEFRKRQHNGYSVGDSSAGHICLPCHRRIDWLPSVGLHEVQTAKTHSEGERCSLLLERRHLLPTDPNLPVGT